MAVSDAGQFAAGQGTVIEAGCVVGHAYDGWKEPAQLGEGCRVRSGTIIYADTMLGSRTVTGVHVLIRERTRVGAGCVVGSSTIIEGDVDIGDDVVLQSGVYVPTHVTIGDRVFIGPRAVLTNDTYPLRRRGEYQPRGPLIEPDASIGANATLLPGVTVGEGAMVAAGAVVTRDVPQWALAVGVPARVSDLPEALREPNHPRRRG